MDLSQKTCASQQTRFRVHFTSLLGNYGIELDVSSNRAGVCGREFPWTGGTESSLGSKDINWKKPIRS